jgi:hypothetical protein
MPKVNFESMPDEARVWVFAADRPLEGAAADRLLGTVDAFLEGWKAHGVPLSCARDWRYERFLIVAVDERSAPPSGCSIDALVRSLKGLEAELGLALLDNSPVWFRQQGGALRRADRATFRALARSGEVGPDTVVFDNTLTRLGELRQGGWERAARESWHGRAFFARPV